MSRQDAKKAQLSGGFAAMFKPSTPAPVQAAPVSPAPAEKPRKREPKAKPEPAAPVAHIAHVPPAPPLPGETFGGKLVASFRWHDGTKVSVARPADVPEDASAQLTYKGVTGKLPQILPSATREEFIAFCEETATKTGAMFRYINAKGGRARKHSREGKRPSEIGIMDGWKRYTTIIRTQFYHDIERIRIASGLSHKEIVDAALSREIERRKKELSID